MKFIVLLFTSLGTCTAYGSQANVNQAMQETKMDFEYPDTENIEIHCFLRRHMLSKNTKAGVYMFNLDIQKSALENPAESEEIRKMLLKEFNVNAENLVLTHLPDAKQNFRTPKSSITKRIISLFACEIPKVQS